MEAVEEGELPVAAPPPPETQRKRHGGRERERRRSRSRSRSRGRGSPVRRREREEVSRREAAAAAAEAAAAWRRRDAEEETARRDRDRDRDRERERERERDRDRDRPRERERERERPRHERDRERGAPRGGGGAPPPPPPPPAPADAAEPVPDEAEQARLLAALEAAQQGGEGAREEAERDARRRRRALIVASHAAAAPPPPPPQEQQQQQQQQQQQLPPAAEAAVAAEAGAAVPPPTPSPPSPAAADGALPLAPPAGGAAFGDMFAEDDGGGGGGGGGGGADGGGGVGAGLPAAAPGLAPPTAGLEDAWDDVDGYYKARLGELLDGRYAVHAQLGRGVFSSVLRARDTQAAEGSPHAEVAIKVIRANDTMRKAAALEVVVLRKLAGADPDGRRHCVRLLRCFEHRSHSALVFESLALNLREVLKKYGRNRGLSLAAVHAYAQQLLVALKHLRNCGVLHADVKPDNVLVSERRNVLKLADFGSAMFDGDNEITPLLVSRFYRAPEIMLGLAYGHPLDMWSVGCVLFELYTGEIAFPGRHAEGAHAANNDMLRLIIEVKGPFPRKMLRRAAFRDEHFDGDLTFAVLERDPVTGRDARRLLRDAAPTRDLAAVLADAARGDAGGEAPRVALLADLLHKMWALDPTQRITVAQALVHPFVSDRGSKA